MGGGADNGVSDSTLLPLSSLYFSACLKYIPFFHPVDHFLSVDVRWDAL